MSSKNKTENTEPELSAETITHLARTPESRLETVKRYFKINVETGEESDPNYNQELLLLYPELKYAYLKIKREDIKQLLRWTLAKVDRCDAIVLDETILEQQKTAFLALPPDERAWSFTDDWYMTFLMDNAKTSDTWIRVSLAAHLGWDPVAIGPLFLELNEKWEKQLVVYRAITRERRVKLLMMELGRYNHVMPTIECEAHQRALCVADPGLGKYVSDKMSEVNRKLVELSAEAKVRLAEMRAHKR